MASWNWEQKSFAYNCTYTGFVISSPLVFSLEQFAADFTEKLLSQSVMARLLRNLLNDGKANHSQILIEEILALDEKFLTVARSNNDIAGKKKTTNWPDHKNLQNPFRNVHTLFWWCTCIEYVIIIIRTFILRRYLYKYTLLRTLPYLT